MSKRILDPCCGSKMFWFDKNNPDVEFCDIRTLDKREYYPGRYIEISPDTVCDFTRLPFENDSFYLVVFDPPHLSYVGDTSIMALKYGCLKGDWRSMLSAGFDECMRVLKPNGVLVFKWSEIQFPLRDILPLFSQKPLFGNRCRKRGNKTHWLCFMKGDVEGEGRMIAMDNRPSPSPCGACEKEHCCGHRKCESWRDWFCEEWQAIRYIAGDIKARRALADDKG